jgi:DNA-binding NtrC family response regulator
VGGDTDVQVDVRVVSSTARDLRDEIAAGRFREDLFFRLSVIPIRLAPLRERREDVLPLARHFLARHMREAGRQLAFAPEAEQALATHEWRGNVRELENAVERGVVLARGDVITPEDLLLVEDAGAPDAGSGGAAGRTLQESLEHATAERVRAALAASKGQRSEAARALGIDRTTLYRLMKRHGL